MRVKDEQLWTAQLSEFEADDLSRKFREFLVSWGETADRILGEYQKTPRGSLALAFSETEESLGFVSVEWLSQMLLVLVQHWFHGDELWESLSVWERRMVEQATVLKIAELQDHAAEVTSDTP